MNLDYALAYFRALEACSYCSNPELRDRMFHELAIINSYVVPDKGKPQLQTDVHHSTGPGITPALTRRTAK